MEKDSSSLEYDAVPRHLSSLGELDNPYEKPRIALKRRPASERGVARADAAANATTEASDVVAALLSELCDAVVATHSQPFAATAAVDDAASHADAAVFSEFGDVARPPESTATLNNDTMFSDDELASVVDALFE